MQRRSRDPRSSEEKDSERKAFADRAGWSVEKVRAVEDGLRRMPIERFLEELYGTDHGAFYDAGEDLWIVPHTGYRGPGFAFTAIRSDRSWFTGVVPPEAFQ